MPHPLTARLSDYLDDEDIGQVERAEIAAHLAGCAACQAAFEELRQVAARARALPDAPPPADLWPGVADRIAPRARVVTPARPAPRRFSFTLPQLAAAGLALMVLSGGLVWMARIGGTRTDLPPVTAGALPTTPVSFADSHYDAAVADLERTLEAGRGRLDPETVQVLEQNLLAIDRAIEQSRRALSADPANRFLNSHLADARKRKLALLRRVAAQLDLEG